MEKKDIKQIKETLRQQEITEATSKILQSLDKTPYLYAMIALDTAKAIISQEFDKKSKEDKTK